MLSKSPLKGRTRRRQKSGARGIPTLWALVIATLPFLWMEVAGATDPSSAHPATAVPAVHGAEQALAALVAERVAEFSIKPKTAVLPTDLALEAATAIKQGDYSKADRIARDVLARSQMEAWRFYPFNEFMGSIVRGDDDPVLLQHLDAWLEREPKSALAYLIRAKYYRQVGAAARGHEVVSMVPARLMQLFADDMARADSDARKALSLNPHNPWSYYELLDIAAASGNSPQTEQAFQSGIKAFPRYYPLYKTRLRVLMPKWGGSVDDMYDFVERYAGRAPDNAPLKLLYLDLYANLLEDAGFGCRFVDAQRRQQCMKNSMRPGLDKGMSQALNLYKVSDPTQYSMAIWPLLETMACGPCVGSPEAVGGVLQIAATVMGSDNRMMDEPTHNSYVLDDITARVWAQMDNPGNADKKFREALSDVEHTAFPDEARKAEALATIFGDMGEVAYNNQQFMDILVYQDATVAVAGTNYSATPHRKCYAYYRMKHYAETVQECTALIEGNGNYLESHYWRGKAYENTGQWDASIADFELVADSSHNYYRVGAALDMSYDYGQKGDYAGQLASMNAHAYLFNSDMQTSDDLATSYNNRCFAYMKLGQLQQALKDCTNSLQHGRIPDALHKQQELLKLLGKTP
jgi:tetratricopeptide (TPR) repeat protein